MSTKPSAPGRVSTRFHGPVGWVRDLPIWTKLGLIMIVPTLATIVVGTTGLLDQVQQASNADRARSLAVVSGEAGNLVHSLQNERAAAITVLNGSNDDLAQLTAIYLAQQRETNEANTRYGQSRSTLADVPENLRSLMDRIQTQLGELPVMRTQVEARDKIPLSITERRYRVLIADLLAIRDLSAQLTGDTTLTDRMRAAAAVANAKEFLSQERAVVLQSLAYGEMPPAVRREYVATRKGQELALIGFTAVATPDQRELLDRTITGPELRESLLFEGKLDSLPLGANPNTVVDRGDWDQRMVGRGDLMNSVEVALNEQAQLAAAELGARVQRRVLVQTGLLLLTLLLGVLFAWLVARSMARSLRDLRQGALAVAQYGLPQAVARLRDPALATNMSPAAVAAQIAEPLPVRSRDEFGQVTEAFNAVHLEAVRTAAEQAALRSSVATMFVNLARRSQILVDRLIGHLDRLERGEQDPDRLSELFQLDHLATRMRRNDENLLVLAGADSTRIQREPAALTDVLRASQSEVEHYTRIEFAVIDLDIEIAAHAVNDVVHLVAELFDNATAFSPPDTPIVVEARRVGDRAVLQVEDRGIGMSPEQYAELNERLATPPMVDVAVSRMMGLVVVARLAARHGVKVELRPAQSRGTVADVLLPNGVLVPRALGGRTQMPAGFPATRPPEMPPNLPSFGPPLALESGSAGTPSWSGQDVYTYGGDSRAAPPSFGGHAGLGAALAGGFGQPPYGGPPTQMPPPSIPPAHNGGPAGTVTNGANGSPGRSLPAWFDLTGATGDGGETSNGEPGGTDPLPHRRPGGQWGDPEPDPEPGRPARQARPGEARPGDRWAPAGDHGSGLVPPPPPPMSNLPPLPSAYPGTPSGGPPVWPPVAAGGAEAVPTLPEQLSASLDLTSELPRMRAEAASAYPAATGATATPSGYADDLTMELPIFRELESAWFRASAVGATGSAGSGASAGASGSAPSAGATVPGSAGHPDTSRPPGTWSQDGGAMVGSTTSSTGGSAGSGWSERTGGADGGGGAAAGGRAEEVSWRSIADEGWHAAQAALEPQDGGTTDNGLPRRVPMAQLVPGGVESAVAGSDRRTPDSVRGLLSAYHRGVQRGRNAQGDSDSDAEDAAPEGSGADQGTSHISGKEQEA